MRRPPRRRRSRGFAYVEVTAAFVVLTIGVLGFAGTIVYTRSLDRTTTKIRRVSARAASALEDVRKDSAGNWSSLSSAWDGTTVTTAEVDDMVDASLDTTVNDDPSLLDSGVGMWDSGASLPNFYHVSVKAQSGSRIAKALNFQTYVADRTGFRSLLADAYQGPPPSGTQASRIDPNPFSVNVTGASSDTLTFRVNNGSASALQLRSVKVQMGDNGRFVLAQIAGTTVYDDPGRPRHCQGGMTGPCGDIAIAPGNVQLRIVGVQGPGCPEPIRGQEIEVELRFADGSRVEVEVEAP